MKHILTGITSILTLCLVFFPNQTYASTTNETILFNSGYEIYTMNPDGSNVHRLTNNDIREFATSMSPDGSKILYTASVPNQGDEIFVMNSDGTNSIRLTTNSVWDGAAVWSPDGNQIAYVSSTSGYDGLREVFIMDSTGKNVHQVTFEDSYNISKFHSLDWSPDGTKLVATAETFNSSNRKDIYMIDIATSNITKVTNADPYEMYYKARFSPDGTKILTHVSMSGYGQQIRTMNVDGTNEVHINPPYNKEYYPTDHDAVWSPDGSEIAFATDRSTSMYDSRIHIMNADGSNLRDVNPFTSEGAFPVDWVPGSPDQSDQSENGLLGLLRNIF